MILLIDNYDSFTYNLYQFFGEQYSDIKVARNDEITIDEIEKLNPQAIIISPGPGYPKDAGISIEAIKHFSGRIPILGICLGHQSICEAFGGKIVPAKELMHGKSSTIRIDNSSDIFKGLPDSVVCARYHSLIADEASLPECLKVIGTDSAGQIMAVEHREHPTYGLQFHPESVLTNYGKVMIKNFLSKIEGIKINDVKTNAPEAPKTLLKPFIAKVVDGNSLTKEEAMHFLNLRSRDNTRTPMQWDNSKYAGFSDHEPWLKMAGSQDKINVENQFNDPNSIYSFYKKMISIRKQEDTLVYGDFEEVNTVDDVIGYKRTYQGQEIICLCNFTNTEQPIPDIQGNILLDNYNNYDPTTLKPYQFVMIKK